MTDLAVGINTFYEDWKDKVEPFHRNIHFPTDILSTPELHQILMLGLYLERDQIETMSSLLENLRRPLYIRDFHGHLTGDHQILIRDPKLVIGDPKLVIRDPRFLLETQAYHQRPQAFHWRPQAFHWRPPIKSFGSLIKRFGSLWKSWVLP